jgi:putative ABC transport system permease protein
MIMRHIARTKVRAGVTILGVSFACSILILSFHGPDAIDELMDVQFRLVERQDARVAFHSERSRAALREMRALDGVRTAEGELNVGVRLTNGWRSKRTGIAGLEADPQLHALLDRELRAVSLPDEGLLLSSKLAELLGVGPGDELQVEVLTGKKPKFAARVASVVEEYLGTFAYAEIGWLSRRLGEEFVMTGVLLRVDAQQRAQLGRELKELPAVAAVAFKQRTIDAFNETMAESQNIMYTTMILFAGVIVFGVLYNAARISMAERERELGSLRVLGFSNREVGGVLVGENLLLVAVGVVPGVGLGALFSWLLTRVYDTDLYRFPFALTSRAVLTTVVIVFVFAILANLAVVRRLRHLDIVDVLKARE